MVKAKNRNNDETVITVKMPKVLAAAVKEKAEEEDLTVSQLVRKLIKLKVSQDEKQAA